jgi:hypothetical protein
VLVVRPANTTGTSIGIFPNPVQTTATIYVRADVQGVASIKVINMQGATLMVQNNNVVKGENAIALNKMEVLAKGVYSLQVTINGNSYITRMVK